MATSWRLGRIAHHWLRGGRALTRDGFDELVWEIRDWRIFPLPQYTFCAGELPCGELDLLRVLNEWASPANPRGPRNAPPSPPTSRMGGLLRMVGGHLPLQWPTGAGTLKNPAHREYNVENGAPTLIMSISNPGIALEKIKEAT